MTKRLFCSAALALVCISCSNGLSPVSGKVVYQGQPAAGAAVFFKRQGGDPMNEHMIMGLVQEDGSFTLVCGAQGTGALPGDYDVLIEWKQGPNRGKGRTRTPSASPPIAEPQSQSSRKTKILTLLPRAVGAKCWKRSPASARP